MSEIKRENIELSLFLSFLLAVNGFPVAEKESKPKSGPWEKHFPNGTVVGQYRYEDKDGNPVHVHYYADDNNYGVEVNSIKVIKPSSSDITLASLPEFTNTKKQAAVQKRTQPDTLKHLRNKHKAKDAILHYLSKETGKTKHRSRKHYPEYETYTLSNIGLKQCTAKKVRVYNAKPEKIGSSDVYEEYTSGG